MLRFYSDTLTQNFNLSKRVGYSDRRLFSKKIEWNVNLIQSKNEYFLCKFSYCPLYFIFLASFNKSKN
jgi:hypothetical protein